MNNKITSSPTISIELMEPGYRGKVSSVMSVGLLLAAVYVFGYIYTYNNKTPNAYEVNSSHGYNDYSVSNAVGNGQKIVISVLVIMMMIFMLVNINDRGGKTKSYRLVLMFTISILLILIVYINPLRLELEDASSYLDAHMALAAVAFALNAVYVGMTYYDLEKKYPGPWYKSFHILTFLNIVFFVFCISSSLAESKDHEKSKWSAAGDLSYSFAAFENLQIASIITATLFLGFYQSKIKTI